MLKKLVIYNSQKYAGTLGSALSIAWNLNVSKLKLNGVVFKLCLLPDPVEHYHDHFN